MKLPVLSKTRMLTPTPEERLTARPAVVLLLFTLVMFLSQLGRMAVELLAVFLIPNSLSGTTRILITLFATAVTVAAVLIYCLAVERRSPVSLGFVRRGAVWEYAVGLLGGLLMFSLAVLLCVWTGSLTLVPSPEAPAAPLMALCLLGFLIQGMSEELLCRSYLMVSLSRGWPLWACAIANALFFSLLHLGNPGVSPVALINIFLFGLFASFLTLRRGSIWMVGGLHSMWNFAQGNLFGIPVSGLVGIPSPLRAVLAEGSREAWINGGAFGLEGGLAVTAVLGVSCIAVLLIPTKRSEISENF